MPCDHRSRQPAEDRLPGLSLDLGLPVLKPVLDRFGDRQVRSLSGEVPGNCAGDHLISSSDGFLMRLDEDLLSLTGHWVPEVNDGPGLNECCTRCKDASPVPLGDGCSERHGYLLNSNQLSEEKTAEGQATISGVDMARGTQ
jgi:hypothetical protein